MARIEPLGIHYIGFGRFNAILGLDPT